MWPAMVLTAGLGTRLRPLSGVRAKPAMPVAGEPLVRRILRRLAACGVREAVLNLHHLPASVQAAVGDARDLGLGVQYSHEPIVLGTAGGPRKALPRLSADRFFIINGDTLADVDLGALAAAHEASGALVTMALVANPDPRFYGGVIADDGGRVADFSPRGVANRGRHFVGTQIVDASAFRMLPVDTPAETIGELYPRLMAERPGSVRAFHCEASFREIGTPADYLMTSLQVAALEGRGSCLQGDGCAIDGTARLARTVLWDRVTVGAGAELSDCVVADDASIPPGARFRHAAIVCAGTCAPGPGEQIADGLLVASFAPRRQDGEPADDTEAR